MSTYTQLRNDPYKPFRPATQGESRSPCPALNALANHSYFPHDGKDISIFRLAKGIHTIYKLSLPLAWIMSIGCILLCGNIFRMSFNLHDLAKHNKIEHDGSIAHTDTPAGHIYAPIMPDWQRFLHAAFGKDVKGAASWKGGAGPDGNEKTRENSSPTSFKRDDFVRARARCDAELPVPLDAFHAEISCGEIVLLCNSLTNENGKIPKQWLYEWMIEEKFPEGWTGPRKTIGVLETRNQSKQIAADAKKMREKDSL